MNFPALPGNLARVREEIARIKAREGVGQPVRIVAVTKGHPAGAVRAAFGVGLTEIGENRVREALAKQDELADLTVHWHLVGHLQRNKAKDVPGRFAMVESVDSVRIADALARAVAGRGDGTTLPVLVQVNVAREPQKSGCDPSNVAEVVAKVASLPTLRLDGLMAMAPLSDDESVQRAVFSGLRRLREETEASGFRLPELSMGMSDDFPAAVAEGATILRLGTVLFGERST